MALWERGWIFVVSSNPRIVRPGQRLSHFWDSVYCDCQPLLRAKEDSWTFGMSPDEPGFRLQLYHVQSTKSRQSMRNWQNAFGRPSPSLDITPTAKPGHWFPDGAVFSG